MTGLATPVVEAAFGKGPFEDVCSLTFSSTSTAGVTTPASTSWQTDELDLRFRIKCASWAPATDQSIGACGAASGITDPHGVWVVSQQTGGEWLLRAAITDGSSTEWTTFSFPLSLGWSPPDDSTFGVRFTLRSVSPTMMQARMFWSVSGHGWREANLSTVTSAMATVSGDLRVDWSAALVSGTPDVCIGNQATSSTGATGATVLAFEQTDRVDGRPVLSLDLDEAASASATSWVSASGHTWTKNSGVTLHYGWTDLSSRLLGDVATSHGRATSLEAFNPPTMGLTLDNTDRALDPANSAGPYNSQLLGRVQIRCRYQVGSTLHPKFRGVVSSGWPQEYDAGNHLATVPLSCIGRLALISELPAPDSDLATATDLLSAVVPLAHRWKMVALDRNVDETGAGSPLRMAGGAAPTDPIIEGSTDRPLALGGFQCGRGAVEPPTFDFTIEAWIRSTEPADHSAGWPTYFQVLDFQSAGASVLSVGVLHIGPWTSVDLGTTSPTHAALLDGRPHQVVWVFSTAGGGNVVSSFYVDGLFLGSELAFATPTLTGIDTVVVGTPGPAIGWPAVSVDSVSVWGGEVGVRSISMLLDAGRTGRGAEMTGSRLGWLLGSIGWPLGASELDPGSVRCVPHSGGSTAAEAIQLVAATEFGQLFEDQRGRVVFRQRDARFNDSRSVTSQHTHTEAEYLADGFTIANDEDRVVNTAPVSRIDGPTLTAINEESRDRFGAKAPSLQLSGLLHEHDGQSLALGESIVWLNKDQRPRIDSITVIPEDDPINPAAAYARLLSTRIGDRVTVTRTPQGVGSPITFVGHVEGIDSSASPTDLTSFTLRLSNQLIPTEPIVEWDTWEWDDDSVWGL